MKHYKIKYKKRPNPNRSAGGNKKHEPVLDTRKGAIMAKMRRVGRRSTEPRSGSRRGFSEDFHLPTPKDLFGTTALAIMPRSSNAPKPKETPPTMAPRSAAKPTKAHTARKASIRETIAINNFLQECMDKRDDGFAEYKEGWSDDKVADHLGDGLSRHSVSRVRRDMFGKLKNAKGGGNVTSGKLNIIVEAFNKLAEEVGSDVRISFDEE